MPVQATNDYRQITGTFSVSMRGDFLPIQLIYKGTTPRCHPDYNFPSGFHVTHSYTHWASNTLCRKNEGKVWDQVWLLICEVLKGQWTDPVQEVVNKPCKDFLRNEAQT